MRCAAAMVTAVLALAGVGCIASHKLAEGELDRYASLHADTGDLGPYYRPSVGGRQLPGKWIVRRHTSLIWSPNALVRADDKLKAGAAEIDLAVSDAHASALADILAEARLALHDLADISRMDRPADRRRWPGAWPLLTVGSRPAPAARPSRRLKRPPAKPKNPSAWPPGPSLGSWPPT